MKRGLTLGEVETPLAEDLDQPGMEPIFWQGRDYDLRVPDWYPAGRMIEHLAYSVARTPGDLTAHMRRFFLCLRQGDPAPLLGSLADLFIALGANGVELRQRVYLLARPLLPDGLAQKVYEWLISGDVDHRALADNSHAVLAARLPGRSLTVPD